MTAPPEPANKPNLDGTGRSGAGCNPPREIHIVTNTVDAPCANHPDPERTCRHNLEREITLWRRKYIFASSSALIRSSGGCSLRIMLTKSTAGLPALIRGGPHLGPAAKVGKTTESTQIWSPSETAESEKAATAFRRGRAMVRLCVFEHFVRWPSGSARTLRPRSITGSGLA